MLNNHSINCKNKINSYPFGSEINRVSINSTSLSIISNQGCEDGSGLFLYDKDGHYCGISYQCVEFVRRYILVKYDVNLAKYFNNGDARDWYKNRDKMFLDKIDIDADSVNEGDIVCFDGGKYGHVGLILEVFHDKFKIASQNFFVNSTDDNPDGSKGIAVLNRDDKYITDAEGFKYTLQGFLRFNANRIKTL